MRYAFRQSCSNVISFLQDALSHPYHHNTHSNKSEEELFKRYNPDLQRRSLENRLSKQQDFDKFVSNLKEYSKSDKPSKFALPFGLAYLSLTQLLHYRGTKMLTRLHQYGRHKPKQNKKDATKQQKTSSASPPKSRDGGKKSGTLPHQVEQAVQHCVWVVYEEIWDSGWSVS